MSQGTQLADRRPTYPIDTPCLTRQYTFRPKEYERDGADHNGQRLDSLLHQLNGYIDTVAPHSRDRFLVQDDVSGSADRNQSIFVSFQRKDVEMELIVDVYREYFTLNFRAYPAASPSSMPYGAALADLLRRLSIHGIEPIEEKDDDPRNDERIECAYKTFWTDHLAGRIEPVGVFTRPEASPRSDAIALYKGIVLRRGDDEYDFDYQCNLPHIERAGRFEPKQMVSDAFLDSSVDYLAPGRIGARASDETAPLDWPSSPGTPARSDFESRINHGNFVALQILLNKHSGFFSRILGFRHDLERAKDHRGGNAVLCGFLDGLALFGSSLGSPEMRKSGISQINYFLLYSGPSRNQLSRLVRRIHFCSDNRIFSLIDYEEVREAQENIRKLSRELEAVNSRRKTKERQLDRLTDRVEEERKKARGGLRYRISQTEYYWSSLQKRVENLRTRRIPGWQTYDEFVERIFEPQVGAYLRTGEELDQIDANILQAQQLITGRDTHQLQLILVPFVFFSYFEFLQYLREADLWKNVMDWLSIDGVEGYNPLLLTLVEVLVPLLALALVALSLIVAFMIVRRLWTRMTPPTTPLD